MADSGQPVSRIWMASNGRDWPVVPAWTQLETQGPQPIPAMCTLYSMPIYVHVGVGAIPYGITSAFAGAGEAVASTPHASTDASAMMTATAVDLSRCFFVALVIDFITLHTFLLLWIQVVSKVKLS